MLYYGAALALLAAAAWFLSLLRSGDGRFEWAGLFPTGMLLVFAWHCFSAISRCRLEVRPEGIRSRTASETWEVPWENLSAVHLSPLQEGLITRAPIAGMKMDRRARRATDYLEQIRPAVRERRFLPLAPFAWNLRRGDFVRVVQRFAPELQLPQAVAAPGAHFTGRQRLVLAGLAALIVGVLALPFVLTAVMGRTFVAAHFPRRAWGGFYALSIGLSVLGAASLRFQQHSAGRGILLVAVAMVALLIALVTFVVSFSPN